MTRVIIADAGRSPADDWRVEMVERKGVGHPDTLSDAVAEAISRAYSTYTLEQFGEVAHHWVDKCMLIGGESRISFGEGSLVRPMKLIVAGKMTGRLGDHLIPINEIVNESARSFFSERLPLLDLETGLDIQLEVNSAVGAGRPARWYRPSRLEDVTPLNTARANDAVICSAYAPLSRTERAVLEIERHLNADTFKLEHPEIGTDIKVLASRVDRSVDIVACVPWIARLTPSRDFYEDGKRWIAEEIKGIAGPILDQHDVTVRINTRDDVEAVYMTVTGTASDTGDVGVVGRGNRINGLIAPGRVTSIEAPAGKNPTYHSGKLYAVVALMLAERVSQMCDAESYVGITTSTGNLLTEPDLVAVELVGADITEDVRASVAASVEETLNAIADVSAHVIAENRPLW